MTATMTEEQIAEERAYIYNRRVRVDRAPNVPAESTAEDLHNWYYATYNLETPYREYIESLQHNRAVLDVQEISREDDGTTLSLYLRLIPNQGGEAIDRVTISLTDPAVRRAWLAHVPTLTPPDPERIVMLDGLLDNVVYCAHCGGIYPRDLMSARRTYDGKIICGDCMQRHYVPCGHCGVAHLPSDGTAVARSYHGNTSYCPTCTEEFLTCAKCGDIRHDTWSISNTSEGRLCRDCIEILRFDSCSCCGLWVRPETLVYDNHDNGHCPSCAEDNVVCSNCGHWADDGATEHRGDYYCDDCYDEITATIHRYDYRPTWRKLSLGAEKNPDLYLGLEIETESDVYDKTAQAEDVIAASEGAAYAKEDGSLDDGIEFCLHPCTAEYLLTDSLLPRLCAAARDAGLRSHDTSTCGLHIHVSKAGLAKTRKGQDYIGAKLVTMVDTHWDTLFFPASRRRGDRWCKKPNVQVVRTDAPDDVRRKTSKCRHDRYHAVNLAPRNTVEIRIWRGTLNLKTLQSTVLLTRAMVDVAKGYSASAIASMPTATLRDKLLTKAKLYGSDEQVKNLINYMDSRGI